MSKHKHVSEAEHKSAEIQTVEAEAKKTVAIPVQTEAEAKKTVAIPVQTEAEAKAYKEKLIKELGRRGANEKIQADKRQVIADYREKQIQSFEEKVKADKEASFSEKEVGKRLEGYTSLNAGQRITARGRIIAGMSVEDAVAFATKPKPQGRSAAALAIRAKFPKKFGKLDASGNQVPPSAAKIAYLKALKEKEEAKIK